MKTVDSAEVNPNIKVALMNNAWGLKNLSIGLRATYILLEDVQKELRLLKQQNRR